MSDPVRTEGKPAAALALARGSDTETAAAEAGVTSRTVRRWIAEDAEFAAEVRRRRDQLLDQAVGALAAASVKAVETLVSALGERAPQHRIRAAVALLAALPALRGEVEIAARLEELEKALKEGTS